MMTSLLAVIPAVVAPLALLAMLLPVLFAGPLRVLQRWWVFFNVCTVSAALYVARFTFLGVRRRLAQSDAWWASPLAFWFALALVAGAGATWVWRRWRAGSPTAPDPGVGEQMVLGLVSLTGLGLVGYSLWDQGLRLYPVQAICTVPLVGWGYAVYLHRHVRQRSATKPLLPT